MDSEKQIHEDDRHPIGKDSRKGLQETNLVCNRFTLDEYAFYALGTLEGPERDLLRSHVGRACPTCVEEIKEAFEFWYVFASLTGQTQGRRFEEPSPMLRDRVLSVARRRPTSRTFGSARVQTAVQTWMRIAAGLLIAAGASTVSWRIVQVRAQKDIAAIQARADQQTAAAKKLESENTALKNLVAAAQNAPAVFPGRDSIISVQDPYMVRDLQRARQTQVAISEALNQERTRAADLEKRLSQTTNLLAAATRDREAAERQYRKAFDAASLEKEHGVGQLSTEIGGYKSKVQDLESQITRYRKIMDAQAKGVEEHQQVVSLLQSPTVSVVHLRSSNGQSASGVVLIADDAKLAFLPSNLPPAPAGRTYQFWLMRDKTPAAVSVGTFNAADRTALQFGNKQLISGMKSVVVTLEPAGGSAEPTGHKVMLGTVKN